MSLMANDYPLPDVDHWSDHARCRNYVTAVFYPDTDAGIARAHRPGRLDSAMAEIRQLIPIDIYDTCPNDDVRAVLAQRILDTHKVLAEAHKLLTDGVPT